MKKRGQAAMEFLMTYGWAILVVLVAIGALAYFGVLNPARFLPSSCTITPGISCEDFVVDNTGAISLALRNGMGTDLNNVTIEIYKPDTDDLACTTNPVGTDNTLSDGEKDTFTGGGCTTATGARGSKFKADVRFSYVSNDVAHTKTGSITTQVE